MQSHKLNRRVALARVAQGVSACAVAGTAPWWQTARAAEGAAGDELTVNVLLDEPIGTIKPAIYGHFAEHLGGVIYDGIWVGRDSKVPNFDGIRRALVEHVRRLGRVVIRWPGGCFADAY